MANAHRLRSMLRNKHEYVINKPASDKGDMASKVTKLAIYSRLLVIFSQFLVNQMIPNHHPDVFRSPIRSNNSSWLDTIVELFLGGLRHWDGEYFLHIAEYGYTYENTLAFYPLYPILVGIGGRILCPITNLISMRNCCLLAGAALNVWLFAKAANLLYKLTLRISNNPVKSWTTAMLFCCNPASIFFTATYSEALFATITFCLIMECVCETRTIRLIVYLALSMLTRSNGLLNICFVVYFLAYRIMYCQQGRLMNFVKLLTVPVAAALPFIFFNFFVYQTFCLQKRYTYDDSHLPIIHQYAREKHFVLSGVRLKKNSPWCDYNIPYSYPYVQSHYWNVGFLKYYQWRQVFNFVLAAPILSFVIAQSVQYLRYFLRILPRCGVQASLRRYPLLPFALHGLGLAVFALFFTHVQISTRLICSATPVVYWFAADYMPQTFLPMDFRTAGGNILSWFLLYTMMGVIMFSNNLPWT